MSAAYLSKSRYLSGLKCDRQLWLDAHDRGRATPLGPGHQQILQMGNDVGQAAHRLFPRGVLVEATYENHAQAVLQTQSLIADESIPAIFEAAFEFETVRIRVDVLERRGSEGEGAPRWGLREVKSSSKLKRERHLLDLLIQRWVLEGCGLEIDSAELVHINGQYVRSGAHVDWPALFVREELIDELAALDDQVLANQIAGMRAILTESSAPIRAPGAFCKRPHRCRYWEDCTSGLPEAALAKAEPARKSKPGSRARAAESGEPWYSPRLAEALRRIQAPVWALDFEAIGPAIPLYPGTSPYQAIAFQWSLHRLGEDGRVEHFEFLADGRADPRPEVARALVDCLAGESGSILAYSGYESRCLADIAARTPQFEHELAAIADRLVDLLPIVRKHVDHPDFGGSFSMKAVGPVLAGAVAYEELAGVADGLGALSTFAGIVQGQYSKEEEARLRGELLDYCQLDTRALLGVYQALARQAGARAIDAACADRARRKHDAVH